jgi:hypothetical protein
MFFLSSSLSKESQSSCFWEVADEVVAVSTWVHRCNWCVFLWELAAFTAGRDLFTILEAEARDKLKFQFLSVGNSVMGCLIHHKVHQFPD